MSWGDILKIDPHAVLKKDDLVFRKKNYPIALVRNTARNSSVMLVDSLHGKALHFRLKLNRNKTLNSDALDKLDTVDCVPCVEANLTRSSHPAKKRKMAVGDVIYTDTCQVLQKNNRSGVEFTQYVSFIDGGSGFVTAIPIKSKKEVLSHFINFKSSFEKQSGVTIKAVRCDNGTEYVNKDFTSYLSAHGIELQNVVSYTKERNGRSERLNRTL